MIDTVQEIIDRPIDIAPQSNSGNNLGHFKQVLEEMCLIRLVEYELAKQKKGGVIKGPIHLAVGQEAVAVGVSSSLTNSDMVFGAHRSHPHILALGTSLQPFFSEILGREDGLCSGFGGSMHLQDKQNGFYGSVPIVAGTVPIALGAALSCKMDKTNSIAISYLGDGAVEEGVVHETMNLATVMEVPLFFVVENNFFASHMHINKRQPEFSTLRFATANHIKCELVDGNNVFEVAEAGSRLVNYARETGKPVFLEAITYRHLGHVDWREDIDVGVMRSVDDLNFWKKRDPLLRLKNYLISQQELDEPEYIQIQEKLQNKVDRAWKSALLSPYPDYSSVESAVYYEDW